MDILNQMVLGLNKENIRHFKLIATRMRAHEDRKDIELFDYIRRVQDKYDENKIVKKLYASGDKNSFYRLRNRLIEDINESVHLLNYRKDDVMYVFYLLSLVRYYFSKSKFVLALRFVKKAEAEAIRLESYDLLDIIYGEYIKLSHEILTIDPEHFINMRRENSKKISDLRQIDDILAAVSHRLKITQNYSNKQTPVLKLLEKTIDSFSNDKNIKDSPLLRFKIYRAVSQVLLQKHDYVSLENYLLATYSTFKKEHLFNKGNHDTKLQILTYIVNSLLKNKKYEQSLDFVSQLKAGMAEYNGLLSEKYQFFYYNGLVLNYAALDKGKAISILEEMKGDNKFRNTSSFYTIFIYINLAGFLFDKQNYKSSIRNLGELYLHDSYKSADESLKFKIAIAELIIRFELSDFDLLEYKIRQLKSEYKKLLKLSEHKREADLIAIILQMIGSDSVKHNKKLREKIKLFVQNDSLEDAEIIKYNDWLNSKV